MALTVEDGTGKSDAESYISVADADTFFSERGLTLWDTMLNEEKEQALRRAADYMVQTYRGRWAGDRVSETQALDWPRSGVTVDGFEVSDDTVPIAVVRACAELAFRGASGELAADLDRVALREKVGPIEVEYSEHGPQFKRYRAVDNLLAPYLRAGTSGLFRAVVRT